MSSKKISTSGDGGDTANNDQEASGSPSLRSSSIPPAATTTTTTSAQGDANNNNTSSPSNPSTLQGLMRGITGALLEELARSGQSVGGVQGARDGLINTLLEGRARLKQILAGVKSDDESVQMESLIELCELLSIATEDTMAGFPSDSFAPALVALLNVEHNPDMMLLACRALSNMIEALPSSVSAVVNHGAVSVLCAKLLSIEYIDLAEQSLQTLEKVSLEQPTAVLRAGGLMAVLSYLDFFSTGVQHQKVVELSCLCFSRLVDSFYDSENKLQTLTSDGLLPNLVRIISGMNNSTITLSPTTYSQIIRIMANLCHGSPSLTLILLQEGISGIIQSVLCPSGDASSLSRSNQQCYEMLSLISELLPPLPSQFSALASGAPSRIIRKKKELADADDARVIIYKEHPELLISLGQGLFGVLVEMFTSTVNPTVRYKCLGSICKVLYFSTPEMVVELLKNFAFSSFLAGLLGSRDMIIVSTALKISELMMDKLPEIFERYFKREGVVYEIDRLSKLEPLITAEQPSTPGTQTSPTTSPTKSHSSPMSIPTTPNRGIPPPLASSPFGAGSFFVGSPMQMPPSTPTSSSATTTTSTSPTSGQPEDMKSFVCKEARTFKEKYLSKSIHSLDSLSTNELKSLKELSERLNQCFDEAGVDVLQDISATLTTEEGVSAFEFLHSGLVASILSYLTRGNVKNHAECFSKVFLVPYINNRNSITSSSTMMRPTNTVLLSLLINKLHDALTKVERFAININEVGGTSSGLKYLAQPFKLKLVKEGSDETLKDYASNIVLIEPLATITAIEEFLMSRVAAKDVVAKTQLDSSQSSTPIHSATSIKEKSEDDMDEDDDDFHDDYDDDDLLHQHDEQTEGETDAVHDVKINELTSSGSIPSNLSSSSSAVPTPSSTSTSTTSTTTTTTTTTTSVPSALSSSPPRSISPPSPTTSKLGIFVDGQRLLPSVTIFQAVQKLSKSLASTLVNPAINNNNNNNYYGSEQPNDNNVPTNRLWEGTHTLKYRYLTQTEIDQPNAQPVTATTKPSIKVLGGSKFVSFLEDSHVFPLSANDTTYEIISLLRILHTLNFDSKFQSIYNSERTFVNASEFVSQKLTAKIMRQLQDPLALCSGALPDWSKQLLTYCPFLFPFECKRLFFFSTSFGIARALSTLQQRQDLIRQTNDNRGEVRVGRIQRQKVRIYRNRILDSAIKVMELYGKSKSILEVEYFGEVGTGLGPTLEFFTLVSTEVQRKDLNLWYIESTDEELANSPYVYSVGGLFPKPVRPSTITKKTLDHFKFLGTFVAKAFFDQRLVDLPLSKPFYKYMINEDLDFDDLRLIAPTFASSLKSLYAIVLKIKEIEQSTKDQSDKANEISLLRIDGAKIEDLCLDFVLPGFPNWDLKENGSNIPVTLENLEEYINLIVMNFMYSGVIQQIDAFKEGFNQIFPITSLKPFTILEVEALLCGALTGTDNDWTVDSLMESTKCDHGYTNSSLTVQNLFKIMSEFSPEERKQFLLFITGSPHLPIQGFKGLNPRLTIVKKHHLPPHSPDDHLLSVMSCTNYIKLPDYTTKDVMKSKLLYAMKEGQSSFHLS
eukprot:gene7971-9365_t